LAIHYQCSDGNWIILSEAQSDRFWHDFCLALGIEHLEKDPKFATAADRRNNHNEIREILDKVFATKTRDEWIQILEEKGSGIAFSPVRSLTELADPQVIENEYIIDAEHPSLGQVKLIGYPIKFSETPAHMSKCAPMFGQHTEEVLMETLGYDWGDIEQLKEKEVI
jgi:crotonobetainyl-CoA:carnitine CoA-transferase CaiB-like acyl-CoA transferase